MKTSKIIFLILIGTIAGIILVALIDLRLNGRKDGDISADFRVKKLPLKLFKVLYITNSMNVTLVKNDSSFIEVTSLKDSIAPKVNSTINQDTLRISDFEKVTHQNASIRIYTGDSLCNINLINTNLNIEHFTIKKLAMNLDQSSVWFNQDEGVKSRINILNISAKNHSEVNANRFTVDSMGISLQHSEANLEFTSKKLTGLLSDSSRIQARQPEEIWLKKDATSKVNINDY